VTAPQGRDWSDAENTATVASYLTMLKSELAGEPYVKSAENERLRARLNDRTKGAVERKYQNISAVLLENGWDYIDGYKPLRNVQGSLRGEVERQLRRNGELDDLMERHVHAPIEPALAEIVDLKIVDPPSVVLSTAEWRPRTVGIKRDYAYRDLKNRTRGLAGELAVITFEKNRLISLGRESLAKRVKHISVTEGDGFGYDVQSFDANGVERFIEVKTTRYVHETPFFISRYEVAASDYFADQFYLYRLFQFGSKSSGMYQLRGRLSESCDLRPETFVGAPRERTPSALHP